MDSRENVKTRRIEANVKGKIIEFDEYYMIDPATGEEVFDRNIEIEMMPDYMTYIKSK